VISAALPEWEDEAFWSAEYSRMLSQASRKSWNNRLWRNESVVLDAMSRTAGFNGQVILDIGAGDGRYFREMIADPRLGDAVYVATDISLAAPRLNRQLNPHKKLRISSAPPPTCRFAGSQWTPRSCSGYSTTYATRAPR
jgi:hypothetical protein